MYYLWTPLVPANTSQTSGIFSTNGDDIPYDSVFGSAAHDQQAGLVQIWLKEIVGVM